MQWKDKIRFEASVRTEKLQEQLLRDRGKKLMKLMKPADLAGSRRGKRQENGMILSQRYQTLGACIPHKGLNLVENN